MEIELKLVIDENKKKQIISALNRIKWKKVEQKKVEQKELEQKEVEQIEVENLKFVNKNNFGIISEL